LLFHLNKTEKLVIDRAAKNLTTSSLVASSELLMLQHEPGMTSPFKYIKVTRREESELTMPVVKGFFFHLVLAYSNQTTA